MSKKFIMMIGVPGCGKTTYVREHTAHELSHTISTDDIRLELFGSRKAGQGKNTQKVWQETHRRIHDFMADEYDYYDIWLDATNISYKRRMQWLQMAKSFGYTTQAIYISKTWNTLDSINKKRLTSDSYVPRDKLKQMFINLQPPRQDEFDDIKSQIEIDVKSNRGSKVAYNYDCYLHPEKYAQSVLGDFKVDIDKPEMGMWHQESLKDHLQLTSLLGSLSDYPELKTVGLWHDLGKDFTRSWEEEEETWHYYGHDKLSARLYWESAMAANGTELIKGNVIKYDENVYKAILWHMLVLKQDLSEKVIKREKLNDRTIAMLQVFKNIDKFSRIGRDPDCASGLNALLNKQFYLKGERD